MEGEMQNYQLDDVEPKVFAELVRWLYARTIDKTALEFVESDETIETLWCDKILQLSKLWILEERLLMPSLQDEVYKMLVERQLKHA